ncbi:MAG: hypothetical protein RIS86_105 [Planctomycetota bacterium]
MDGERIARTRRANGRRAVRNQEPQSGAPPLPDKRSVTDAVFEILGWVPALVFPMATGIQLLSILHTRRADGVSVPAWTLFAAANICLFVYTEKYGEIESILGALGTAVLNLCIVAAAIRYRRAAPVEASPIEAAPSDETR